MYFLVDMTTWIVIGIVLFLIIIGYFADKKRNKLVLKTDVPDEKPNLIISKREKKNKELDVKLGNLTMKPTELGKIDKKKEIPTLKTNQKKKKELEVLNVNELEDINKENSLDFDIEEFLK